MVVGEEYGNMIGRSLYGGAGNIVGNNRYR